MDIELKQVSSAVTTESNKEGKCAETERFEREKGMKIFDMTTKEPASGVLVHLDASLVIKLGDFVNVSADPSHVKMLSHAG
jgi:hypothetical protein